MFTYNIGFSFRLSVVIAKNNKQIDDKIRVLQKQRVDESSFVLSSDFIIRNEPRKLSQIEKRFSGKDDSSMIAALADRISSGLEVTSYLILECRTMLHLAI